MRRYIIHLIIITFFFSLIIGCNNQKKDDGPLLPAVNEDSIRLAREEEERKNDTAMSIYLTFDDGPYHSTPNVIGFLNNRKIKASFFAVGKQITYSAYYDSLFKAEKANPLFKIYNHSFSHNVTHGRIKMYYSNPPMVWEDIRNNKRFLDTSYLITRLPGQNTWRIDSVRRGTDANSKRMIAYLDEINSKENLMGWDFEWDSNHSNDTAVVNDLLDQIDRAQLKKKGSKRDFVILFHDYLFPDKKSIDNLDYFVSALSQKYKCKYRWAQEYPGIHKVAKL